RCVQISSARNVSNGTMPCDTCGTSMAAMHLTCAPSASKNCARCSSRTLADSVLVKLSMRSALLMVGCDGGSASEETVEEFVAEDPVRVVGGERRDRPIPVVAGRLSGPVGVRDGVLHDRLARPGPGVGESPSLRPLGTDGGVGVAAEQPGLDLPVELVRVWGAGNREHVEPHGHIPFRMVGAVTRISTGPFI